jgi:acyl-coenzyme A synthetase/AMP-(fatty) acid ligase
VVLIPGTFADRAYYSKIAAAGVTSLACVSQIFEYMRQLQVDASVLPAVNRLTHSGSALDSPLFSWVYESFGKHGASIYLMYGQTEACGRMTVLEPDALPARHRSVGHVIRGSAISRAEDGEIVYRGPGVMQGYATCREDLALGDVLQGILHTGDVGILDEHGYLFITGRKSRYCKVFGQRVNLDDVEACMRAERPAAVVESNGTIAIFFEGTAPEAPAMLLKVAQQFQLPPSCFRIHTVQEFPRTPNGKIAYSVLLSTSGPAANRKDATNLAKAPSSGDSTNATGGSSI